MLIGRSMNLIRLLSQRGVYGILQDKIRQRSVSQENPIPPIPKQIFDDESFTMLVRLKQAFSKLKHLDSQIQQLRFNSDRLEVETAIGSFLFQRDFDQTTLYFTSPISGVYKYYYNTDEKRWISNKDYHILQDNLVRQTSKYFKAYLEI